MTMNSVAKKQSGTNIFMRIVKNQCFIPLAALLILIIFNLVADPSFFRFY